MQLFHTSPIKIEKINDDGRFGHFLFFSTCVYKTTSSSNMFVYSIDIDQNNIIEARQLFYHSDAGKLTNLVSELASKLNMNENIAESLIEESISVYDLENIDSYDIGDLSWDVQGYTARASELLGYDGVRVDDEQGSAYMINMKNICLSRMIML